LRRIEHLLGRRPSAVSSVHLFRTAIACVAMVLGLLLSGANVSMAAAPASVTVHLSPASILADGISTAAVTGTVTDSSGVGIGGEKVMLSAPSDAGIKFAPNPATTGADGSYTSTLTSSLTPGQVVVLAVDGLAVVHPDRLTQFAASATSLKVLTSEDPSVTNDKVTLISTVTSLAGGLPPAGTVSFENGGVSIAGCSTVQIPVQLTPSVDVTCQTSFGATSSPSQLSAVFTPAAGSLILGSSSPSQPLSTNRATTVTTLSSVHPTATVGAGVTFAVRVIPSQPGSRTPTGTVVFADEGRTIGRCRSTPLAASSSTALCTVSYSSPGAHTISAAYLGDSNFAPSTSGPATVAVRVRGTISVTMQWTFTFTPTYAQPLVLAVDGAPSGATILLKCRGHGCPFAARSIATDATHRCGSKPRRHCGPPKSINLLKWFGHRRLRVGARIVVRISKPGWVGKQYVFVVRARRVPRVQITCPEPGESSPGTAC
jgi:hypothetical protein